MLFLFRLCFVVLARSWRNWLLVLLLWGVAWPAAGQFRLRIPRKTTSAKVTPVVNVPPNAPPADPPAVRVKLFQAARLANSFKDSEALAVYQEVLKATPAHYLALWQSAVLSVKIGSRYSDETRKSAYFDAARQYADRALLVQPEGGESNYAVALALFKQATLYRARARLAAFRELRSHVYLAVKHRPDLPEAWQLLGRWQYRVAHYNLLERIYSNLLLGGVPDGGNSREAMQSLEKAHQLAPQNIQFCYDLARMCVYQGRRRRAIEILREAEKIPPLTSDDLVVSRLCRKMLPPLQRADARRQRRMGQRSVPVFPPPVVTPDSTRFPTDTLSRKQ
ncbi:tetratricopeptide repeat protein [Hymenobacter terrenus]|uniref:tetratricopeptide repeat protein n=1 Tax=Hymenobacter terrenus TaxID=1629124 RepID=UPI0006195BB0|nr:tetratricopeptide repeat protein [Hymenobacter terrenus]